MIRYLVLLWRVVGVPVILQVVLSNNKPVGSAGSEIHVRGVPPFKVAEPVVIAAPFAKLKGEFS